MHFHEDTKLTATIIKYKKTEKFNFKNQCLIKHKNNYLLLKTNSFSLSFFIVIRTKSTVGEKVANYYIEKKVYLD